MKKIKYTPDAADKLRSMKTWEIRCQKMVKINFNPDLLEHVLE